MPSRLGYCWNKDYCPVAHAGTMVRVEDSAVFVCPECARPLRVASKRTARVSRTPHLAAAAVVLMAASAAAVTLWPAAPKPVRLAPVWVRMEIAPPVPAAAPVRVTLPPGSRPLTAPPAAAPVAPVQVTALASRQLAAVPPMQQVPVLAAPAPAVMQAPEPVEVPSILMRLQGDPVLEDQLMPRLAQAFLRSTGDQDVEISRSASGAEVRGRSDAGLEAVNIVAAPTTTAFASLANGGAEVVFSARPPTLEERQGLGKWREDDIADSPTGTASLFVPVPSDPVAVAFVNFARSPKARAAIAAAGFAPPAPPAPPAPAPKPASRKVVPPEAPAPPPKPAIAEAPPAPPSPELPATPPAPPAPSVADEAPELGTTPAGPRKIVLPAGSRITFGPLKDVEMPAANPRMVFLQPGKTPRPPGKLQVDCMIQTSGVPTDCRQVSEHGDQNVSDVILRWLGSGAIRYSPATKNGHLVEERRVLTVNFREPVAHDD